jgi:hypothetical protein
MSLIKKIIGPSVLLLLCLYVGAASCQADEMSASTAISEADSDLALVFEKLLEAEELGADVVGLLEKLDEAGGFLATAHINYGRGNFSGALYFAELTIERLDGLDVAAVELVNSVGVERGQRLSLTVMGSVVGIFIAVFVGFVGWSYVKAWFVRRILKMKPEVKRR